MLDRTGKPTARLRASVLREELEVRLQRLQELEHWIKERAGADNRERVCADAVAVAIDQRAPHQSPLASSSASMACRGVVVDAPAVALGERRHAKVWVALAQELLPFCRPGRLRDVFLAPRACGTRASVAGQSSATSISVSW